MKKHAFFVVSGLLLAQSVFAAVTVTAGPTPLVTSPITAKALSGPIVLFSATLTQSAGETLSSVAVDIANAGTSAAVGSDLASVSVYKDDGDGSFDSGDALAGSQTSVNIGSSTIVTTGANNVIGATDTKFFVTLATSSAWSDAAPADSITVTLPASGIVTSASSPTVTPAATGTITADTTAPVISIGSYTTTPVNTDIVVTATTNEGTLNYSTHTFTVNGSFDFIATDSAGNVATKTVTISNIDKTAPALTSAKAQNTGGTGNKEAGDSIVLTFSETTNKPVISAANIATIITLNNSHSFIDGAGALGTAVWSSDGKKLTITLTAGTSLPTVALGDTVTIAGSTITDVAGNAAAGSQTISGSFAGKVSDDDEDEDEHEGKKECSNKLINGRLYQIGSGETIYLAADCALKVFKGKAVGKAEGKKFKNIIVLSEMPLPGTKVKSEKGEDSAKKKKAAIQPVSQKSIIRDLKVEKKAIGVFIRLFRRLPKSSGDWLTTNFLAYGGVVTGRDLAKEKQALKTYILTFHELPKTSEDWQVVHALAYGGGT